MARTAADLIEGHVAEGAWRLGVATGATPLPTYAELVTRQGAGHADLGRCHLVLLDEYVGLGGDDPRSYRRTIFEVLAEPLNIPTTAVHGPPDGVEPEEAAQRFAEDVRQLGGVDLQILGIGRNGHVGFNEPGSPRSSRTRVVELADETRDDNARYFGDPEAVPPQAITRGLADISEARSIMLLATGAAKADALRRLLTGDPSLPAAALIGHPSFVIVADEAALSESEWSVVDTE